MGLCRAMYCYIGLCMVMLGYVGLLMVMYGCVGLMYGLCAWAYSLLELRRVMLHIE